MPTPMRRLWLRMDDEGPGMRARIALGLVLGISACATPQPPGSIAHSLVSAQGNALALHDALEALIDERSDTPTDREFAYTSILRAPDKGGPETVCSQNSSAPFAQCLRCFAPGVAMVETAHTGKPDNPRTRRWSRLERPPVRRISKPRMNAFSVVVGDVFRKPSMQMPFVEHDHVVQEFA